MAKKNEKAKLVFTCIGEGSEEIRKAKRAAYEEIYKECREMVFSSTKHPTVTVYQENQSKVLEVESLLKFRIGPRGGIEVIRSLPDGGYLPKKFEETAFLQMAQPIAYMLEVNLQRHMSGYDFYGEILARVGGEIRPKLISELQAFCDCWPEERDLKRKGKEYYGDLSCMHSYCCSAVDKLCPHDNGNVDSMAVLTGLLEKQDRSGVTHQDLSSAADELVGLYLGWKCWYYIKEKLSASLYGMPLLAVGRYVMATLVSLLDKDTVRWSWQSDAGRSMSLHRYRHVSQYKAMYRQVVVDAPKLLKLFGVTFRALTPIKQRVWAKAPLAAVKLLKEHYQALGMTNAAWKVVSNLGPTQMATALTLVTRCKQVAFVDFFNLAVKVRAPIYRGTVELYAEWFYRWRLGWENAAAIEFRQQCSEILMDTAAALADRKKRARWIDPERLFASLSEKCGGLTSVEDYLRSVTDGETAVPVIPRGAGASWLDRQQRVWHRDIGLRRLMEERRCYSWSTAVETFANDSMLATALVTTEALVLEGYEMHHCVGGYSRDCVNGESRIFAVTSRDGAKLATVELCHNPAGSWNVRQCYGPANRPVGAAINEFAKKLADEYTKVSAAAIGAKVGLLAA